MLARHDEGAANVAVLHEALTVRFIQNTGNFQSDIAGGFRDRNNHVDVEIVPFASNLLAELRAHIYARAVDGNLVDEGVRAGEIDVFKQTRVADRVVGTLTGKQLALLGDIHRFARRNVTQEFEAQGIQRHALRGNHIFGTAIAKVALAQHQRTNAVWIAEGNHTVTDNHRHAGVCTADLAVGRSNGSKDIVCFQRVVTEVIQLAGEHVEQDFRIRGGVNVATFLFEQLFTQLMGVGQVAVMGKGDAIR